MTPAEVEGGKVPDAAEVGCWRNCREEEDKVSAISINIVNIHIWEGVCRGHGYTLNVRE